MTFFNNADKIAGVLRRRSLILLVACMVMLGSAAGGTVAWLMGETAPIENVFTPSDIDITLTETDTDDGDDDPGINTYELLPGADITKDPVVSVLEGSEDAWVFVCLHKSANFDQFLTYEVAPGWQPLQGVGGVYWRQVPAGTGTQSFEVLKDNTVSVLPSVTSLMLNTLTEETFPTLTVSACAVQMEGIALPEDAWALLAQ